MKVSAVVVTRNRKTLLLECLKAIRSQTRPVDAIFVIDNASSDGTEAILHQAGYLPAAVSRSTAAAAGQGQKGCPTVLIDGRTVLYYTRLARNVGGAGGFQLGLRQAFECGYDWMWIMDDDTVASKNALGNLLAHSRRPEIGFACSKVLWTDGSVHLMNIPQISPLVSATPFNAADDEGLLLVNACSFVSVLVGRRAIARVGYPIGDFFIWLDDIEFTRRIVRNGFWGVYVKESVVYHHTPLNRAAAADTDRVENAWKYYYQARNHIYLSRKSTTGLKRIASLGFFLSNSIQAALKRNDSRFLFLTLMLKGFAAGLRFEPQIEKASDADGSQC